MVTHRYILRHTKQSFRSAVSAAGPEAQALMAKAEQDLQVVKRQAVVYSIYSRPILNVLVSVMAHRRRRLSVLSFILLCATAWMKCTRPC